MKLLVLSVYFLCVLSCSALASADGGDGAYFPGEPDHIVVKYNVR